MAFRLVWLKNPGDSELEWRRHDVSRRSRGMFDKFLSRDLDNDGAIDSIGTRGNSVPFDGVFWIEQVRSSGPIASFEQFREVDSTQLLRPKNIE